MKGWLIKAIGVKTLVLWVWEVIDPIILEWAKSDGKDDWDDAVYRILKSFFEKFDAEYDGDL